MEDLFLHATSNLDKLLDEFEEKEASSVKQNNKTNKTFNNKADKAPATLQSTSINAITTKSTPDAKKTEDLLHPATSKNGDIRTDIASQEQNNVENLSDNLLIDFSAPDLPVAEVSFSEPAHNSLTGLDFLLPVLPQQNQFDSFEREPPGEILSLNTRASENEASASGDALSLSNSHLDLPDFGLPVVTTSVETVIAQPKACPIDDESTKSALVGFNDIQVDDSEFADFMEESNQTENSHTNPAGFPSASLGQSDALVSNVDDIYSSSYVEESHATGLAEDIANHDQQIANNEVDDTSVNKPKLEKNFRKDAVPMQNTVSNSAASSIQNVPSLSSTPDANDQTVGNSEVVQSRESLPQAGVTPSISATIERQMHEQDSALLSQVVVQNNGSVNATAPSSGADAVSQTSSQSLSVRDPVPEIQRIPSVSPPSYSSVIAGEYNAGTIIEETPAAQATAASAVINDSHQDEEVVVEQAIEAMEESSHTGEADRSHSLDPRQRFVANPAMLQRPGEVKPRWMPDDEASSCTKCNIKFTFTRRRHHCRACGQIFCSSCCSDKSKLAYLKYTEARVCISCYQKILQADAYARMQSGNVPTSAVIGPTTMPSAPISVMRTENAASGSTPKSVRFSDGTKPDHPDVLPSTPPPPPVRNPRASRSNRSGNLPQSLLPPLIKEYGEDGTYTVDDDPDVNVVLTLLKTSDNDCITFALSANLFVLVKIVQYSSSFFYYFISSGLDSVGHAEVALLLEVRETDDSFPMQAFSLYSHLFNAARKGKAVQANDFLPIEDFTNQSENLFGSNDYAGLIFVQRTVQSIENLLIDHTDERSFLSCPTVLFSSTLYALLVRKSEVPWAKLFYSRLLFGLGAKYKQYPYPLVNYHDRPPVCFEVANTILSILCDFRNYKYKVVTVPGLSVITTKEGVIVNIPYNRFVDVMKIINSSNEHVVALGSNTFLSDEDCQSHLVCLQDQSKRTYHSQVLSQSGFQNENDGRVGAAFIVFNGSLKSGSPQQARCSIVEDGVMVQLLPEKMNALKEALKAVEDFRISCQHSPDGPDQEQGVSSTSNATENTSQYLEIRWVADDTKFNFGLASPIDFRSFEGVVGYNVQGKSEKKGKNQVLRWNQVFIFKTTSDILDMSRLAEKIANGCFQSLLPHVKLLRDSHQTKIGVRVNIHPEDVGYAVGSRGLPLPDACLNALDDGLISLTHEASSSLQVEDDPVVFELIFSVLDIRPSWKVVAK